MKHVVTFCFFFLMLLVNVEAQDPKRLHELGKNYMIDGDYDNAESLLFKAYHLDTSSMVFVKDLTLCLYFQKQFKKALKLMLPKIENGLADDQCFQITGNIYRAMKQYDQMESLYKTGLKKFPEDGALYNEMGEVLAIKKNDDCIKFWEKGIEKDPAYPRNYYNACRYYSKDGNIWGLLYGEIYVNIDPFSTRSSETKEMLLQSYRLFFQNNKQPQALENKSKFEQKSTALLAAQKTDATDAVDASTIIMYRAGFILEWFMNNHQEKYPFLLFDRLRFMLREGIFEAYNQWLLGSAENLTTFQNWTQLHAEEYNKFLAYIKKNNSTFPRGQYHQ